MDSFWPTLPAAPDAPFIIHIQDAHGHAEAQKSLSAILQAVREQGPGSREDFLVAVEGAWGPVDVEPLRAVPDGRRKGVAEELLLADLITGEEMLAALEDGVQVVGVEDPRLHRANARARESSRDDRKVFLAHLENLSRRADRLKTALYPSDLNVLEKSIRQWREGAIPLEKHLETILAVNGGAPPGGQVSLFLDLSRREGNADPKALRTELASLMERDRLSDGTLAELTRRAAAARAAGDLLPFYRAALAAAGRPLPAVAHAASLLERKTRLNVNRLNAQVFAWEERAAEELLRRADHRAGLLRALDHCLSLERRLWAFALSPREWIRRRDPALTWPSWEGVEASLRALELSVLGASGPREDPAATAANRRARFHVESFYRLALKRNGPLVENTLRLARERSASRLALVAGGFHTPGLTARLRRRGASYLVAMPAFDPARESLRDWTRWQRPEGRADILKRIDHRLSADDAAEAAAWRERLSPADRALMKATTPAAPESIQVPLPRKTITSRWLALRAAARRWIEGLPTAKKIAVLIAAQGLLSAALYALTGPGSKHLNMMMAGTFFMPWLMGLPKPADTAAFDDYATPDALISAKAEAYWSLLLKGDKKGADAFMKDLAARHPDAAQKAQQLVQLKAALHNAKTFLGKGDAAKSAEFMARAEDLLKTWEARNEGLAARLYLLLSREERVSLYTKAGDARVIGRMGFRDYFIRRHEAALRALHGSMERTLSLLEADPVPMEDFQKEIQRQNQLIFEVNEDFKEVLSSSDIPFSTRKEKDAFKQEVKAQKDFLVKAFQWRKKSLGTGPKNDAARRAMTESLGREIDAVLRRLQAFHYPQTTESLEKSRRYIDGFTTPLIQRVLRQMHSDLISDDEQKIKTVSRTAEAVKAVKQARRRFPRNAVPANRNQLPAVTTDLTAQAYREKALSAASPGIDRFPEHDAAVRRVKSAVLGGKTAAVTLSAKELKGPFLRTLAHRLQEDGHPSLRRQKLLHVDLAETLRQSATPTQATYRVERLLRAAVDMGDTALVLDLDPLLNEGPEVLETLLSAWKAIPAISRPSIVALSTEETWEAVLKLSDAYGALFGEPDEGPGRAPGSSDGDIFQETALSMLEAKNLSVENPETLSDFFREVSTRTPFGALSVCLRLLETAAARADLSRKKDARVLNADDLAAEIQDLPAPQELPFAQRLRTLRGVMPPAAYDKVRRELSRYNGMQDGNEEKSILHRYLFLILNYPWDTESAGIVQDLAGLSGADLEAAIKRMLQDFDAGIDQSHFGMKNVRTRLRGFLARMLDVGGEGEFLIIDGPPGVGKTSILKTLAGVLKYVLVVISMAGLDDAAVLEGRHIKYQGEPGRIVMAQILKRIRRLLVLLDEIDKSGHGGRGLGDPTAVLLQVTDRHGRKKFLDHFFEIEFDLSDLVVIGTANDLRRIPAPLLNRAQVLSVSGYSPAQKERIAAEFSLPRLAKEFAVERIFGIPDAVAVARMLVRGYIDPADRGVRNVIKVGRRFLGGALLSLYTSARPRDSRVELTAADVPRFLGPPLDAEFEWPSRRGEVLGLAAAGHELRAFVSVQRRGAGLELDGLWQETRAHSAHQAETVLRPRIADWSKKYPGAKPWTKADVHARKMIFQLLRETPGDDSSNGLTLAMAGASAFLELVPRPERLVTAGEVDGHGNVTPISLQGRIAAASAAGARTVMLPFANKEDLLAEFDDDASLRGVVHMTSPDGKGSLFLPLLETDPSASPAEQARVGRWNEAVRAAAAAHRGSPEKDVGFSFDGVPEGLSASLVRLPEMVDYRLVSTLDQAMDFAFLPQEYALRREDPLPSPSPVSLRAKQGAKGPSENDPPKPEPLVETPSSPLAAGSASTVIETVNGPVDVIALGAEEDLETIDYGLLDIIETLPTLKGNARRDAVAGMEAVLREVLRRDPVRAGHVLDHYTRIKSLAPFRKTLLEELPASLIGHLLMGRRALYFQERIEALNAQLEIQDVLKASLDELPDLDLLDDEELAQTAAEVSSLAAKYIGRTRELIKEKDFDELADFLEDRQEPRMDGSVFQNPGIEGLHQRIVQTKDPDDLRAALQALQEEVKRDFSLIQNFINPETSHSPEDARLSQQMILDMMMNHEIVSLLGIMDRTPGQRQKLEDIWTAVRNHMELESLREKGVLSLETPRQDDRVNGVYKQAGEDMKRLLNRPLYPLLSFKTSSPAEKKDLPRKAAARLAADASAPPLWRTRRFMTVNIDKMPLSPREALKEWSAVMTAAEKAGDVVLWVDLDKLALRLKSHPDMSRAAAMGKIIEMWEDSRQKVPLVLMGSDEVHPVLSQESTAYASLASPRPVDAQDAASLLERELAVTPGPDEDWSEALEALKEAIQDGGTDVAAAAAALEHAAGQARVSGVKRLSRDDAAQALEQTRARASLTKTERFKRLIRAMPEENRRGSYYLLSRLQESAPGSAQASEAENLLEDITSIPWGRYSPPLVEGVGPDTPFEELHKKIGEALIRIRNHLDVHIIGMEEEKDELMEVAVVMLHKRAMGVEDSGDTILFDGPPGVGKSQLAERFGEALGLETHRLAVGGQEDASFFNGEMSSVRGARKGAFAGYLKKTMNPALILDEVDKIGQSSEKGDPSAPLLSALDPEQNKAFPDNLVGPVDLSRVLFIGTSNDMTAITEPVFDRFRHVIRMQAYARHEKLEIAAAAILPKLMKDLGPHRARIPDLRAFIEHVVDNYTNEPGVRELENVLGSIMDLARAEAIRTGRPVELTPAKAADYHRKKSVAQHIRERPVIGESIALSWSPEKGGNHFVQSNFEETPSAEGLRVEPVGKITDYMKGSINRAVDRAVDWLRERHGLDGAALSGHKLAVSITPGDIKKDGPSAGVPLAASIASALSKALPGKRLLVRNDAAMSGTIDDDGRVHAVDGIANKILAAGQVRASLLFLPKGNKGDLLQFLRGRKSRDLYGVIEQDGIQTLKVPALVPHPGAAPTNFFKEDMGRRRKALEAVRRAASEDPAVVMAEDAGGGIELQAPREVMEAWLARHREVHVPMTYILVDRVEQVLDRALVEASDAPSAAPARAREGGSISLPLLGLLGLASAGLSLLLLGKTVLPLLLPAAALPLLLTTGVLAPSLAARIRFQAASLPRRLRRALSPLPPAPDRRELEMDLLPALKVYGRAAKSLLVKTLLAREVPPAAEDFRSLAAELSAAPAALRTGEAGAARLSLLARADRELGGAVTSLFASFGSSAARSGEGRRVLVFDRDTLKSPWLRQELEKHAGGDPSTIPAMLAVFDDPSLDEAGIRREMDDSLGPLAPRILPIPFKELKEKGILGEEGRISVPLLADAAREKLSAPSVQLRIIADAATAGRWVGDALNLLLGYGQEEVPLTPAQVALLERSLRALHSPEEAERLLARFRDGAGSYRLPAREMGLLNSLDDHLIFAIQA